MNRFTIAPVLFALVVSASTSCTVYERPPQNAASNGAPAANPPPPGNPPPPSNPPPAGTPPATMPTPVITPPPVGTPPTFGTPPSLPTGGLATLPGVCIPIGSWSKQFDNGIPASGTVDIGSPIIFNQFPITDGVVVATAPVGTLKGTGAMTSTNDLSVDVTNGAYVLSYTCKFGGNCTQGSCTTTKGGLGGFKLVKR